jgi:hypothetical protein
MSLRPNNESRCPQSGMSACPAPGYPFFGLVDTFQFKGFYWHGKHVNIAKASEVDNKQKLN